MADATALRSLIARCQRQDRAAFGELFEQYHRLVFRNAYLLAHRRDAADDITQLVFVELFSALRRYDANRSFLPWLYRIIHNIGVDYLKANRRGGATVSASAGQLDALLGPDPSPGPAMHAEQAESRHAIWRAMARLSPEQRSILVLCYYADLRERELATALGVRPGTVKSRLHRARQALRAELARDTRGSFPQEGRERSVAEPAPGSSE